MPNLVGGQFSNRLPVNTRMVTSFRNRTPNQGRTELWRRRVIGFDRFIGRRRAHAREGKFSSSIEYRELMERGKYPPWSERERLLSYSTGVIEPADHAMSLVTSTATSRLLGYNWPRRPLCATLRHRLDRGVPPSRPLVPARYRLIADIGLSL
jgi:hypothetical protein